MIEHLNAAIEQAKLAGYGVKFDPETEVVRLFHGSSGLLCARLDALSFAEQHAREAQELARSRPPQHVRNGDKTDKPTPKPGGRKK